jgi:hypothetical protein
LHGDITERVDKSLDRRLEISDDHFGLHVQALHFLSAPRVIWVLRRLHVASP